MKKLCLSIFIIISAFQFVHATDSMNDWKYFYWNSYTGKPDGYMDKVSSAAYADTCGSGGGGTVIKVGGLWQLQDGRLSPYPAGLTDTLWELVNGQLRLK